jgi:thiamine kinase-like enzyme
VSSAENLTPEAVIARIDDWRGLNVSCEPLGGGITNHNYVVSVEDGSGEQGWAKYVLRIPGEGTDLFIDRGNECECSIAAAQAGVSPRVAYAVDGALVIEFVDGVTIHTDTLAGWPDRIRLAVETVKRVHEHATFPHEIDVFELIRRYAAMAREVEAPSPPEFAGMFAVIDEVEQAMERDKPVPVACHNDLLSENFLVDKTTGRMWIIDWEYGGMADPFFDLGDFCTEHPFTTDEEKLVLRTYCGDLVERRYYRMLLHKLTADLWWSIWAMIQSKLSSIDFDYLEYGMNRVRRFQANAGHAHYNRWITGV